MVSMQIYRQIMISLLCVKFESTLSGLKSGLLATTNIEFGSYPYSFADTVTSAVVAKLFDEMNLKLLLKEKTEL